VTRAGASILGFPASRLRSSARGDSDGVISLGRGAKGLRGVVVRVGAPEATRANGLEKDELERRLLEIGFVEGASVEILHEGMIGRDPIAVRLDDMRVALRRREAAAVFVRPIVRPELLEAAE
jgi:ferrous iron transport protein A